MAINSDQLKRLVKAELEGLTDPRVLGYIRDALVEPRVEERRWDYGAPGQTYPCWIVLDDSGRSGAVIAYCEFGFGPRCPWGLVGAASDEPGAHNGLGMDSGWFTRLLDAFFESFASTELPIWRVFKGIIGVNAEPVSEEGEWHVTWQQVYALRQAYPQTIHNVWHSIAY